MEGDDGVVSKLSDDIYTADPVGCPSCLLRLCRLPPPVLPVLLIL
jgi:hypothetical protein